MAHSSYDYMFSKPALRFLMDDYMQVNGTHTLQLLASCLVCYCWNGGMRASIDRSDMLPSAAGAAAADR